MRHSPDVCRTLSHNATLRAFVPALVIAHGNKHVQAMCLDASFGPQLRRHAPICYTCVSLIWVYSYCTRIVLVHVCALLCVYVLCRRSATARRRQPTYAPSSVRPRTTHSSREPVAGEATWPPRESRTQTTSQSRDRRNLSSPQ